MKLTPEKISGLSSERRDNILRRSMQDVSDIYEYTKEILDDIRDRGDAVAVEHYKKYKDDIAANDFLVTRDEIEAAYKQVEPEVVEHLKVAAANIKKFHAAQLGKPQWQMALAPY